MNKKLFYYFIFCISTGTIIYVLQKLEVSLPKLINNYLNDFLIIPIVLYISLKILQWSRNDKSYTHSIYIILYLCALYSVLFEFVFPKYLARYTKDIVDVMLYFASGCIFYFLQKDSK
jgi:hypothetical protein